MEFGFGRRMRIIQAVIYGRSLQCTFASGQGRQDIIALRRTGSSRTTGRAIGIDKKDQGIGHCT